MESAERQLLGLYQNTLVLQLFEVVKLIDFSQDGEDSWWILENSSGKLYRCSCLIEWYPLKSVLTHDQYDWLKKVWNLNHEEPCN